MSRSTAILGLLIALVALSLSASALDGELETLATIDPDATVFGNGFQSKLTIDHTISSIVTTSYSELHEFGFLWQEFGLAATLGTFEFEAETLFGPMTAGFLYAHYVAEMSLGGVDLGTYGALLGRQVLGGSVDGFAFRLAGSAGQMDFVSITEFGARIADDDFDGITIVHAASGFSRSYRMDPIVLGRGFTGQKITVRGFTFCCIEDLEATFYTSCAGFEYLQFAVDGITTGLDWLSLDVMLRFGLQTKAMTVEPALHIGDVICFTPHLFLRPGLSRFSITAIAFGGIEIACQLPGVTIREISVLYPGHYVISTPEHGSLLESILDAINAGHDYHPDFWELLSIEIDGKACCGGDFSFLLNTYFDGNSNHLFDWAMLSIESHVGMGGKYDLSLGFSVSATGEREFRLGFAFSW